MITNWHVVRDAAGPIAVVFPDGFQSAAQVLKLDPDWDLAALLIWRPRAAPIALANVPPKPGDMLTIAGYGSGTLPSRVGPLYSVRRAGREHAVRDGGAVSGRPARRLRRADLQRSRRAGRRVVWFQRRDNLGQLLRPSTHFPFIAVAGSLGYWGDAAGTLATAARGPPPHSASPHRRPRFPPILPLRNRPRRSPVSRHPLPHGDFCLFLS